MNEPMAATASDEGNSVLCYPYFGTEIGTERFVTGQDKPELTTSAIAENC